MSFREIGHDRVAKRFELSPSSLFFEQLAAFLFADQILDVLFGHLFSGDQLSSVTSAGRAGRLF